MKRKLCAVACACLLLAGCGTKESAVTQPETTAEIIETESPNLDLFDAAKDEILNSLSSSSFCYTDIEFGENYFHVSVSMDGIESVVNQAISSGVSSESPEWDSIREATITGYNLVKNVLEESIKTTDDISIQFDLVGDIDHNRRIVSVLEGDIDFDVLEASVDAGGELSESDKALISLIKSTASDSFNNYTVDIKNEIVYVSYSYPGLTNVEAGLNSGNETILDSWNNLVDVTKSLAQGIGDIVNAYGSDYHTTVSLLDDSNLTKYLVIVIDGIVVYNLADNV